MTKINSKILPLILAIFLGTLLLGPGFFAQADSDEVKLEVKKLVRNLSRGDTRWYKVVTAEPSDVLLFRIEVRSTGDVEAKDIMVRDVLPSKIIYLGDLKADYVSKEGNVSTEAVNIGDLSPEGLRIVSFKAQVAQAENFSLSKTNLINTVIVYTQEISETVTCKVTAIKESAIVTPTAVTTGITNRILDSILLPLGIALAIVWIFKSKFIGLDKWAEERKKEIGEYRAKKTLKRKITQLRTKGYFKE